MRFIRKEHIVTTIFNEEISEDETIKTVFSNLYKHRIEFSMTIKKYFGAYHDYKPLYHEKVRIKKIYDDNTVDFTVFKGSSLLSLKKIHFSDIVEINATTKKNKILDVADEVSRFDILDIQDE